MRDYWQSVHCGEAAEAKSGGPGCGWKSSTRSKQTPSTTIQVLPVNRQSEDNIWGSQGLQQPFSVQYNSKGPYTCSGEYMEL